MKNLIRSICLVGILSIAAALSTFAGPRVTVIGDSYSAFTGTAPSGYAIDQFTANYPYNLPGTDVTELRLMYWQRVIDKLDGSLIVNNSWSGATVSDHVPNNVTPLIRRLVKTTLLGEPDLIIVMGGANDAWTDDILIAPNRVIDDSCYDPDKWTWGPTGTLATFRPAFCYLLYTLKQQCPQAEIVVAVNDSKILSTKPWGGEVIDGAAYASSMIEIARHYGALVADCTGLEVDATGHPTATGMSLISERILEAYAKAHQPNEDESPDGTDPANFEYADERVTIKGLPTGFVPSPKDLGGGFWCYVFDKPADNLVVTLRKNLVISRALVVGGGGSGGICWGGGGGGGGVWTNAAPIDVTSGATVTITVGAGGAKVNGGEKTIDQSKWVFRGNNGGTSQFVVGETTCVAAGGGGGGAFGTSAGLDGANGGGGSGNLGAGGQATMAGGHSGASAGSYGSSGGGGGAALDANGGRGGEGVKSDIIGSAETYGSGGGGSNSSGGAGGTNAGDGSFSGFGSDAKDGFGGGGGGGGYDGYAYPGGKGGDGTVILVLSDPPNPELPAAHVSAETSGDHSHTVEVRVDTLGEGASSATVSLAYGLADGSLGAYRTVAENVAAGATVSCAMTDLSAGNYRYAVKVVNDLGKEKTVEGRFRVVDQPPSDATGERIGLKGDLMTINLVPNEKGQFAVSYYIDVDIGAFNCDVYKRSKMVLRKVPASETGYPCRPIYVSAPNKTDLRSTDVSPVPNAYWIGIFEVTKEQYARIKGNPWEAIAKPMTPENLSNYNMVRSNDDRCTYPAIDKLNIEYRHIWDGQHNIIDFYSNPANPVAPNSFFGKLNAKCVDGLGRNLAGFDLPTERQWEIAARAGSFKIWGSYWDGTKLVDGNEANFNQFSTRELGAYNIQNVGTRKPNAWGLYDTLGMLWEMCLDVWNDTPSDSVDIARSEPEIPPEPASHAFDHDGLLVYGGERVIRGVMAGYGVSDVTPSSRSHWRAIDGTTFFAPPDADGFIGFRVSCPVVEFPPLQRIISLWITDHADAGSNKVHLAFQPIFDKPVDMSAWITYARENGLIHYVAADTEAELKNAPLKDDFTFRGETGTQDVVKGWCWITVPATNKLYKIVICGNEQLGGVQLWENGPYFAECNVGATKPEEFGDYFWWGDTVGYVKSGAKWKNARTGETGFQFASQNCPTFQIDDQTLLNEEWIDTDGNLTAENDAATAYLGSKWRMPTSNDIEGLIANCSWKWTNNWNDTAVAGCVITGKTTGYTDKSIFLPATGYAQGTDTITDSANLYWSSTRQLGNASGAANLRFFSGYFGLSTQARCYGLCVRPVRDAR